MAKNAILITGKKRSGKDYVAEAIQKALKDVDISSKIFRFADPMKDILSTTLHCTKYELEFWKNNESSITLPNGREVSFRAILQKFGTEAMKPIFGDDVWASLLCDEALENSVNIAVISDWRFNIEIVTVSEYFNSYTVGVINNDIVSKDTHSSETELDDTIVHFLIDNTGKPDLTEQINACLEHYKNYIVKSLTVAT